jgi:hypothetical protein
MITWREQGAVLVQDAPLGIVTWKVWLPDCCVEAVEPAGKPSAMIGWVEDHTGLLMIAGVQLVPDWARGSASVVSVWVELAPWASAMRNQPGCATVAVTDTERG